MTTKHQRGAVLITSLIILLLLTIIGVTSMRSSIMEEKIAQNTRDQLVSFESAESALVDANDWITDLTAEPKTCDELSADCSVYNKDAVTNIAEKQPDWWENSDNSQTFSKEITEAATDPNYIVEYRAYIPDSLRQGHEATTGKLILRVTASGTGISDTAQTILETTNIKRFN
ncbi:MAG: PilX N-terminal domain-containing pilus assembly protein [Gammaproteobacteria bacterium]|jgi:type IV pilus assembly protein PilX